MPRARGVKRPSLGLRARNGNFPAGEGAEYRFQHVRDMGLVQSIVKNRLEAPSGDFLAC
jgi:hypothetical protein